MRLCLLLLFGWIATGAAPMTIVPLPELPGQQFVGFGHGSMHQSEPKWFATYSKEVLSSLQQYANEHVTAKEAASEAKTREGDLALIESLDADGNGSISISEFMGLCKLTGLGKAHMRRKFREKDY
ncbi:MAG: hypothetical protein HN849_18315, partial [Victivallales bacterium]|nr:hypothetical protein [Victivallales bacterium]